MGLMQVSYATAPPTASLINAVVVIWAGAWNTSRHPPGQTTNVSDISRRLDLVSFHSRLLTLVFSNLY